MYRPLQWQIKIGKIIIDDKFKLKVNTGDSNSMIFYASILLLAAVSTVILKVSAKKK